MYVCIYIGMRIGTKKNVTAGGSFEGACVYVCMYVCTGMYGLV
jgi:hypothetical protein